MARITLLSPGQAVADFAVNGTTITIAGLPIDCLHHQQDTVAVLEVRQSEAGVHLGGEGAFLAHIEVPARTYMHIAVDLQAGEPAEQGPANLQPILQPLDAAAIHVQLWPLA